MLACTEIVPDMPQNVNTDETSEASGLPTRLTAEGWGLVPMV